MDLKRIKAYLLIVLTSFICTSVCSYILYHVAVYCAFHFLPAYEFWGVQDLGGGICVVDWDGGIRILLGNTKREGNSWRSGLNILDHDNIKNAVKHDRYTYIKAEAGSTDSIITCYYILDMNKWNETRTDVDSMFKECSVMFYDSLEMVNYCKSIGIAISGN